MPSTGHRTTTLQSDHTAGQAARPGRADASGRLALTRAGISGTTAAGTACFTDSGAPLRGHLHLRSLRDTLERVTEIVGRAAKMRASRQPSHTERAPEVPRNSGHPPGDRGCPASGTPSGDAMLTPTKLGDLGWTFRTRWSGSSRGSRSPGVAILVVGSLLAFVSAAAA